MFHFVVSYKKFKIYQNFPVCLPTAGTSNVRCTVPDSQAWLMTVDLWKSVVLIMYTMMFPSSFMRERTVIIETWWNNTNKLVLDLMRPQIDQGHSKECTSDKKKQQQQQQQKWTNLHNDNKYKTKQQIKLIKVLGWPFTTIPG